MSNKYDQFIKSIENKVSVSDILESNPTLKNDPDFFMTLLNNKKTDTHTLGLFSDKVKGNRDVVLKAITTWPHQDCFQHACVQLREDKNIAYIAIRERNDNIKYISENLKNDEEFMLNLVSSIYLNNSFLKFLPTKYKINKEFLKLLLKKDYQSYQYIDDSLKNDLDLLMISMFDCNIWYAPNFCFKLASQKLQADKELVKNILLKLKSYRQSKDLIAEIKDLHKIAAASEKSSSAGEIAKIKSSLKHIKSAFEKGDSWDYKKLTVEFNDLVDDVKQYGNDKKLIELLIVADIAQKDFYSVNKGISTTLLQNELLKDFKFLGGLMDKTEGKIFKYLPLILKNNKDFIINNFSTNINKDDLPEEITKDKQFFVNLLERCSSGRLFMIHHVKNLVDSSLFNDYDFIKKFIKYDGSILKNASNEIKKDKKIILEAIKNFSNALAYADNSLLKDSELLSLSLKNGGDSFLDNLSLEDFDNKDFIMQLLTSYKEQNNVSRQIMRKVSHKLKKDKDIALACVARNGWALENVDDSIKYDADILTTAFKTGAHVYKVLDIEKLKSLYTPKELKKIASNFIEYILD